MKERLDMSEDPACIDTTHHGRKVHVCICSTDQCNKGVNGPVAASQLIWTMVAAIIAGIYY
jgi:hypothetical protein